MACARRRERASERAFQGGWTRRRRRRARFGGRPRRVPSSPRVSVAQRARWRTGGSSARRAHIVRWCSGLSRPASRASYVVRSELVRTGNFAIHQRGGRSSARPGTSFVQQRRKNARQKFHACPLTLTTRLSLCCLIKKELGETWANSGPPSYVWDCGREKPGLQC